MLNRAALACLALCLSFAPAAATKADQTGLVKTVDAFEKAMTANEIEKVIAMVPQKVFAEMARELKVSPLKLAALVADQMETVLKDVTVLEFGMSTDDVEIEETKAGISYAFLPTRTIVEVTDTKVETKSHTLALRDGDEWSLVRIDDAAQLRVLRKVYPGFETVDFPRSVTSILD